MKPAMHFQFPKGQQHAPTSLRQSHQPVGKQYCIRRHGKNSAKAPETTPRQIAERIRRSLVSKR